MWVELCGVCEYDEGLDWILRVIWGYGKIELEGDIIIVVEMGRWRREVERLVGLGSLDLGVESVGGYISRRIWDKFLVENGENLEKNCIWK